MQLPSLRRRDLESQGHNACASLGAQASMGCGLVAVQKRF